MKPVKSRAYFSLIQIALLFVLVLVFFYLNRAAVSHFFYSEETGRLGLLLNGGIILLFLLGLARIMIVMFDYAREQEILNEFMLRLREKVANPTYNLPPDSLIMERYSAVQILGQQNAAVDQAALAAVVSAEESSRFTLIRFVHNILILAGVFGTIVSLSVALVGASGLLNSPDSMDKMGTIIGGMSSALSTTITAILCYVVYSYLHLRLQDTRGRVLANLEEVTTLYIMPRFQSMESNLLRDVAVLTQELRRASETMGKIQDRFLHAGERLQLAVDDLQTQVVRVGNSLSKSVDSNSEHIRSSSEDLQLIREFIREGFRLEDHRPAGEMHTSSTPANARSHYDRR